VELLTPVVARALVEAGISDDHVDAVGATVGPGLVGALLVGVSAAKALALVWGVPFVAVNHLEAHLYACFLEEPDLELPIVVMLVSGGHTLLILMEGSWPLPAAGLDDRRRGRRGLRQGGPLAWVSGTRVDLPSIASPWPATPTPSPSPGPSSTTATTSPSAG